MLGRVIIFCATEKKANGGRMGQMGTRKMNGERSKQKPNFLRFKNPATDMHFSGLKKKTGEKENAWPPCVRSVIFMST